MKIRTLSAVVALPFWFVASLAIAQDKKMEPTTPAAEKPTDAASTDPIKVDGTSRDELEANVGKTVTVKGAIIRTKDWDGGPQKKKKMNFMDMKGGFFSTVTWEADFPAFGANLPATAYKGKTIEITGELETRNGKWQIVLKSPDQVKVLDSEKKDDDKKDEKKDKKSKKDEKPTDDKKADEPAAAEDAPSAEKKRVDAKKYFNK